MKDYFGTRHYPCRSDTHTDGEEDCDEHCAAVARGERDELAAEVVALREALERYGVHDEHCQTRTTAYLSSLCDCGLWALRPLTDPSPAVAEIERLVGLGRKAEAPDGA